MTSAPTPTPPPAASQENAGNRLHFDLHANTKDDDHLWLSNNNNPKPRSAATANKPLLSELAAQADAAGLLRLSLWTDGDGETNANSLDGDDAGGPDSHHDDSVLDWLGQDDPDDSVNPAAGNGGGIKQAFFHPISPLAPATASASASPSPIDLNSKKAISLADISFPASPTTPSPLSNPPPSASSKTSSIRFSNLLLDGVSEDLNSTTLELRPLSLTDMKVDLELLERSKNRAKNRRAMMLAHQDSSGSSTNSNSDSKDTLPLTPTPDIPNPGQGMPGRGASGASSVDTTTDPTTPTTISVASSFANLHLSSSATGGSRSPTSPSSTTVSSSLTSIAAASSTSRAASSEQLAIMRSLLASTASAEHTRATSPNPAVVSTVPPTPSTIGADNGSNAFPSSAPSVASSSVSSPPLDPHSPHYALPSPTALSTWSAPEPAAAAPTAHRRLSVTSDRSTGSGSTFRSGVPRPARSASRSRAASSAASTTSSSGGTAIAPPTPRFNYNAASLNAAGGLGGSMGSLSVPSSRSRTRSRSPSAPHTSRAPQPTPHHYHGSSQPPQHRPFDNTPSEYDLEPMARVPTPHAAPAAPTPRPLSVTTSGDDVHQPTNSHYSPYHPHQPSDPMPLPSRTAPPKTPLPSTPGRPKTPTAAGMPPGRPKTPTGAVATSGIPRPKTPTTGIPRPKTPLSASQSTTGLPRPKTPLGDPHLHATPAYHGSYQSLLSPPGAGAGSGSGIRRARSPGFHGSHGGSGGSLESLIPPPRATSPSPAGPRGGLGGLGGFGAGGGLRAPSPSPMTMRAPSPSVRTPTAEHLPRIPPPSLPLPTTPGGVRIPPPSAPRARSPSTGAMGLGYPASGSASGIPRAVSPGGVSTASSGAGKGIPRPSGIPRPKTPTRGPSPRPPGGGLLHAGARGAYQHADSAEF